MKRALSLTLSPFTPSQLLGVLSVAAIAAGARPVQADEYHWDGENGSWSTPANWSPFGVPGFGDVARIGDLPGVQEDTVFLDINATVAGLHITDGMGFQTEGHEFIVHGPTTLFGEHTRLVVHRQTGGFFGRNIVLGDTSFIYLNGGELHANGVITVGIDADIQSNFNESTIWLIGEHGTTLNNNGRISSGPQLSIHQGPNTNLFDLDGTAETGRLEANLDDGGTLNFTGRGLSDPFSGEINLYNGTLGMFLAEGWEADASSSIVARHFGDAPDPNRIEGTPFTFGGALHVDRTWWHRSQLVIDADTTISDTASVVVDEDTDLTFAGPATVLGGEFSVGNLGTLIFENETTMRGGTFSTVSASLTALAGGSQIGFNGPTEWNGDVVINGSAVQNGDATVSGALGATIDATRFDMDGGLGITTWNVNAPLIVNAERFGGFNDTRFEGTINVAGGFTPRLSINLDNQNAVWTMAGEMNLNGFSHLLEDRVSGSPMIVEGNLNITGNKVQITADACIAEGSLVNIDAANTVLRMTGVTDVQANAFFGGLGTLRNGSSGVLTLLHGAALHTVGLANEGVLELDHLAGEVSVDRFENAPGGTLKVSIGGYVPGAEHDVLRVTGGPAVLDGALSVELIDVGAGAFEPIVGDEFTVLRAPAGISGSFNQSEAKTTLNGKTYKWSVNVNTNRVVLRLEGILLAG